MSRVPEGEPQGSPESKLAQVLWLVIPAALVLLGLAALFGLTP